MWGGWTGAGAMQGGARLGGLGLVCRGGVAWAELWWWLSGWDWGPRGRWISRGEAGEDKRGSGAVWWVRAGGAVTLFGKSPIDPDLLGHLMASTYCKIQSLGPGDPDFLRRF